MKAIITTFVYLTVIAAVNSKGLRAIISYTYDESFEGAKLYGQELSLKAFEKLLSTKDFGTEPKLLSSTYSIFGLLDGKCDVKIECCKNCDKTCSVASTPKVLEFVTTPPLIENSTKPHSRKTPAIRKVDSVPDTKHTPQVVAQTAPPAEATTLKTPAPPRKPAGTRKFRTRPAVKVIGVTPPPLDKVSEATPLPQIITELTALPAKVQEATPPPPQLNALPVKVLQAISSPLQLNALPAKVSEATLPPPQPTALPAKVLEAISSPLQSTALPAKVSEATPPPPQLAALPAKVPDATPSSAIVEKVTPPVKVLETTAPSHRDSKASPPAGRVNRMINRPSKKPFRGPPYLPQPEVTTPRVDHTWKTYAHRDVTYRSQTWQPFVATGTWIPNTAAYDDVTAAPKYVGPSNQLERLI